MEEVSKKKNHMRALISKHDWEAVSSLIRDSRSWSYGDRPLLDATWGNAPEEVILSILAAYTDAARTVDTLSMLPLHWAVKNKLSLRVIQSLIRAYPKGSSCMDAAHMVPLHVKLKLF
jgi:hypothetical protein